MKENTKKLSGAADSRGDDSELSYQNMFWLFMVGNMLGVLVEGIWCVFRWGHWETHVTFIWGPFNIVYGVGAVGMYAASVFLSRKKLWVKFTAFSLVGAAIEYIVAVFQEKVFNSTSWDYSRQWFNLGGKISIAFTLAWGVLGVFFVQVCLPPLKKLFRKNNSKALRVACWVLTVFMAVNAVLSLIILTRWGYGAVGHSRNPALQALDKIYPADYLQSRFVEWKLNG